MWKMYVVVTLVAHIMFCGHASAEQMRPTAPSGGTTQSADELYSTWDSNNRTNHQIAYRAGKDLMVRFADDPRVQNVRAWIAAYEKIMASGKVADPIKRSATAGQQSGAPSLEDAKTAVLKFTQKPLFDSYNAYAIENGDIEWDPYVETSGHLAVKKYDLNFDECILRIEARFEVRRGGAFPDMFDRKINKIEKIDLSKVDPVSIRGENSRSYFSSTEGNRDFVERTYFLNDKEVRDGEIDVSFSALSSWDGQTTTFILPASNRISGSGARLANALKDLTRACGAKVSPY